MNIAVQWRPAKNNWGRAMDTEILTVNEFCRRNKVGRTTAYRLLAQGLLEAVKIGGATRILPEQEEAFRKRLRSYRSAMLSDE